MEYLRPVTRAHVPLTSSTEANTESNLCDWDTCQQQSVAGSEFFQLLHKLTVYVFEPVAFINDDVFPLYFQKAKYIILPHHQLVCGKEDGKWPTLLLQLYTEIPCQSLS